MRASSTLLSLIPSAVLVFRPQAAAGQGRQLGADRVPAKGWFTLLRLYGPLEPWFRQTSRPDNIVLQP